MFRRYCLAEINGDAQNAGGGKILGSPRHLNGDQLSLFAKLGEETSSTS